jgi:hypothetical protein
MSTSDREVAESDLIAFDWAKSLSQGEQDVILVGHLKQLQSRINAALTTARAEQAERVWKEAIEIVLAREKLNKESYEYWKSIASEPDTNFGVLKFAAWGGEDSRIIAALEAAAIRAGVKEGNG